MGAAEQRQVERWFVRRGLPHFIEGYSAGTDIWTRSLPVLVAAYLLLGLNALQLRQWSVARNLAALAGLVAIVLATWVVANVARRRPALSAPRKVGPAELAVFVLGPALPAVLFGGQIADAARTVAEALLVLAVVYVATSYGLPSMLRWGASRIGRQLLGIGRLFAKALPLVTLLVTFLFLTTETWEIAAGLHGLSYWVAVGSFVVVGTLFVVGRLPQDVREIGLFASWDDLARCLDGTPLGGAPPTSLGPTPLTRRQWLNVSLVFLASQGLQILLMAAIVGAFVIGFGVLTVSAELSSSWAGGDVHVLWEATLDGRRLVLTEELLRVAGFLVAFAGLNLTVYLVTDETYRAEFREEVVAEVRQAFAVREVYLAGRESDLTTPAGRQRPR